VPILREYGSLQSFLWGYHPEGVAMVLRFMAVPRKKGKREKIECFQK